VRGDSCVHTTRFAAIDQADLRRTPLHQKPIAPFARLRPGWVHCEVSAERALLKKEPHRLRDAVYWE
jgi:hypothetical protein